jgi:hypothetical protein
MALLDFINPFNRIVKLADKAIIDKDKKIEFDYALNELQEQVYLAELNTKTVPWVDAVHKMGRQIISIISIAAGIAVLYISPNVDPLTLVAVLGPGGIYNMVKGKGK